MVEIRLARDRVRIGDVVVPRAIDAFADADWAAIPAGPVDLVLAVEDVFVLMVDAAPTRRAVAAAVAGRSPLRLQRACWGFAEEEGRIRVAMAHRATVRAPVALLRARGQGVAGVTGAGILLWQRQVRAVSPWWALAAIPALTGMAAWGLAMLAQAAVVRERPAATARARQAATVAAVAAVQRRMPVSDLLARIAAVLPADAMLHALAGTPDGEVVVTIDTQDPDRVRAALARDPALRRLRAVGQEAVADRGIRMRLRGRPS